MANNFIKQYVADKRTGANLVGIHVDTQSQYLLDRGSGAAMLSALEEIGKKADEAKIQNEKQNLLLSAEEQDLQFKKEVLSDPLLYKDEERYRNALTQFETIRREKESRILKSEYLTADEKKLMARRIRNNDELTLVDMMSKRNGVVIEKQVDDIVANMDRRVAISSDLSLNDVKGAELAIQDFTDMADNLQKLTGMTDSEVSLLVSERVMRMEEGRFNKAINEIVNSSMNLDQKRAKINNLLSVVKNDNLLTKMAESYASQIKYSKTDEEFKTSVEFFKSRINDIYENVGYTAQHHLERIEYNQAVQKRREERNLKKNTNNQSFEKRLKQLAINNDADGAIKLLNGGMPYTTNEKLEDSFMLKKIYDKDMNNFGNPKDSSVGSFLSNNQVGDLKNQIKEAKDAGISNYEIAQSLIYPAIEEIARGDQYKKVALLKDLGSRGIYGFDIDVLLNGENDEAYYQLKEEISKGKNFKLENPQELSKFSFLGTAPRKIYYELVNELGGGYNAEKALDSLVKGYSILTESPYAKDFKGQGNQEMIIEAFNEILGDEDFVEYVKNNKEKIRKIEITPINYKKTNLNFKNLNIKEIKFEKIESNEEDNFLLDTDLEF